jgi:outer membrane protein TolC
VAITDLIDAQSTALSAGLAVTDAKYHFVADLVAVLRAVSEFDLLLDPQAAQRWLDQVYAGAAATTSPFTHEDSR